MEIAEPLQAITRTNTSQGLDSMILITVSNPRKDNPRKSMTAMIAIPLEGVTLDSLVEMTNKQDPWERLSNDDVVFLRPMTMPTLIRNFKMTDDLWDKESEQVRMLLSSKGCSVMECTLLITRNEDGAAWTLSLPPLDVESARIIVGIE